MAVIRLLVPVAGDLAPGVPAPAVGAPVEVEESIATSWCDGDRAELVVDYDSDDVKAVHAGARAYLDAVLEQHAAELAQVHADAQTYLAAALAATPSAAGDAEASADAETSARPARRGKA